MIVDRISLLIPEITLLVGAVLVSIVGLSSKQSVRNSLSWVTIITLLLASILSFLTFEPVKAGLVGMPFPELGLFVKPVMALIGVLLVMVCSNLIDVDLEKLISTGKRKFDPLHVVRGEFFALFLLSITGAMLVVSATDLIWLFLALELVSLPTYVMIAMSRSKLEAQESALKYFFLGALSTGILLYGFAMLYGASGTLVLQDIVLVLQSESEGVLSATATIGLILSVLAISYKIAAVPMHFYAPDVYEGAAAPMTAFLGFVPKAAGFFALIIILEIRTTEGNLYETVEIVLWVMAVLTMTLGNVGAILQSSLKRILGYSSIAHSGYLLLGILAGPGDGYQALLIYLVLYGISNTGAFAVLASVRHQNYELSTLKDLSTLRKHHPAAAWGMAICSASLLGLPPLIGFWGKLFLFAAAIKSGHLVLVVIAALNSGISSWYYLKMASLALVAKHKKEKDSIVWRPNLLPFCGLIIAALLSIFGAMFLNSLSSGAEKSVSTVVGIYNP